MTVDGMDVVDRMDVGFRAQTGTDKHGQTQACGHMRATKALFTSCPTRQEFENEDEEEDCIHTGPPGGTPGELAGETPALRCMCACQLGSRFV